MSDQLFIPQGRAGGGASLHDELDAASDWQMAMRPVVAMADDPGRVLPPVAARWVADLLHSLADRILERSPGDKAAGPPIQRTNGEVVMSPAMADLLVQAEPAPRVDRGRQVLEHLRRHGPSRVSEIAECCGMTKSAARSVVFRLHAAGRVLRGSSGREAYWAESLEPTVSPP